MNFSKYVPDRKWLSGGTGGILAWALATYLGMDQDVATQIGAAVGAAIAYLVPPSVKDIIKRVDDTIIGLARQSPDSPATMQ